MIATPTTKSAARLLRGAGLALGLGLAVTATAAAQTKMPGTQVSPLGVVVDHGWTTLTTEAGDTTAGYFRVHNVGATPDTLLSTSCPIAHHTVLLDGSGKKLGGIVIKPGETLTMAPGGMHLMLTRNRYRFYAHGMIPCSVDFLDAGKLILYLHVEQPGAKAYEQVRRPVIKD